MGQLGGLAGAAVVRIVDYDYPTEFRNNLFQDLEALGREIRGRVLNAGKPPAGFGKALHKPARHRVGSDGKNDWDLRGGGFYRCGSCSGYRTDHRCFVSFKK